MKKATAIGFRSNSWFAGLNTTIPDTDIPENKHGGFGKKYGDLSDKLSDEYKSMQLKFPLHGTIGNGNPSEDDQFFPDGAEDSWHVTHFVFEHEMK